MVTIWLQSSNKVLQNGYRKIYKKFIKNSKVHKFQDKNLLKLTIGFYLTFLVKYGIMEVRAAVSPDTRTRRGRNCSGRLLKK